MAILFIILTIFSSSFYSFADNTCNDKNTKKQIEISKPVPDDESTGDDSDIQ